MANNEHLKILEAGPEKWNLWRTKHPGTKPDFSGAVLRRSKLQGVDFSGADLRSADLSEGYFAGANLSGANLHWASLNEASLAEADLTAAALMDTQFCGTDLRGADFSDAIIAQAIFTNVDFSRTKGLEQVRHGGPSSIGIDTIHRSKGLIPEVFLRGAGVPENFITFMHSLVGKAFEFYSCFISYSSKDQVFAARLHGDLQATGVRCWFAPHDVQGGKKLHEQIDHAIRIHEKLLLIISPSSMSSEWVKTEIAKARWREIEENKQVLFPIRLVDFEVIRKWVCFDADSGKDSAREIREYLIPDFSNWTDGLSYKKAFEQLLKDLRGERKGVATQGN